MEILHNGEGNPIGADEVLQSISKMPIKMPMEILHNGGGNPIGADEVL